MNEDLKLQNQRSKDNRRSVESVINATKWDKKSKWTDIARGITTPKGDTASAAVKDVKPN